MEKTHYSRMDSKSQITRQKIVFGAFLISMCIAAMSIAYLLWGNTFSYSNLVDEISREKARELLTNENVSVPAIEHFLSEVDCFYNVQYTGLVDSGWKSVPIVGFSYDDNNAIEHFNAQSDYLFSCRAAAFALLKDNIQWTDSQIEPNREIDPLSREHLSTQKIDLEHFDLLFSDINIIVNSSAQIATAVADNWNNLGIGFDEETVHLITAYAVEGDKIENWHSAVSIFAEGKVWLLEKYDPIYPFQLSCFDGECDLVTYMKQRVRYAKYAVVMSDANCLWTK